jgi:hypothetical protein
VQMNLPRGAWVAGSQIPENISSSKRRMTATRNERSFGSLRKAPHEMAREMRAELARRKVDAFAVDEEGLERELD